MTEPRQVVFEVLQNANKPMRVTDLAKLIEKVDKVSVYRTVDLFEKIGVTHRVWTGFKSKVELSDAFSPHHHHFMCLECGKTLGIKSEKLEDDLCSMEKEYGFKLTQHSIELSGFCGDCRDRPSNIT